MPGSRAPYCRLYRKPVSTLIYSTLQIHNKMTQQLQKTIDQAWEDRANFSPKSAPAEVRDAVAHVIEQLNQGTLRVAQKTGGDWTVNQWIKKAVLLSFRLQDNVVMPAGGGLQFYLTRRFMLRSEYRHNIIFTSRDNNEEVKEWKYLGFAFFFLAATVFLTFFTFLAFAFDFFAFFAMFDLPIVWPMVQRSCRHWSERSLQCRRHSAPRRPIDQLDRVDNRDHRPCRDLPDASDIAGGDHVGLYLLDIPDFARTQHLRKIRMKNVVGSGGAAAQMALRHLSHLEAQSRQQRLRFVRDSLTMRKRARCVIGDHLAVRGALRQHVSARQILTNIHCER